MDEVYIALGGNVGDVVAAMETALDALGQVTDLDVGPVSRVYETEPVGSQAGGGYLNAAATLETSLSPDELLDVLQQIEQSLGRTAAVRWTSRVIDLDLLVMGQKIIDTSRLTVPHPHLWYRRFVLDPLAEIAGDVVHPVLGVTLGRLRESLRTRPLTVSIVGGCAEDRLAVGSILRRTGMAVVPPAVLDEGPLRIRFLDESLCDEEARREVILNTLPGSLAEAATAVVTAALDEPRVHSRPLRKIP